MPSTIFNPLTGNFDLVVDDAAEIIYSPADLADWSVLPDDTAEALDSLAENKVNTASNVGAGAGVFKSKISQDLQFKSLVAGTNVSLSAGTDTITISASGGGGSPGSFTGFILDTFNGDGTTTIFTLSAAPTSAAHTDIFIGGVYQQKATYTVVGTTLTFTEAPPTGVSNIEVKIFEVLTATLGGGTTGQVLTKNSNTSGDYSWATPAVPATAAGLLRISTFTSSGTWTKQADVSRILVHVIGGGGGGGPQGTSGAGGTGGTSSFGAHCSATGGGGGTAANSITQGGGAGGLGSNGDVNMRGNPGNYGSQNMVPVFGVAGGASFFGGGGVLGQTGFLGGGGAGGRYPLGDDSGNSGGGGGCSIKLILATSLGATETVTIGAGGAGSGWSGSGSTSATAGGAGTVVIYEYGA